MADPTFTTLYSLDARWPDRNIAWPTLINQFDPTADTAVIRLNRCVVASATLPVAIAFVTHQNPDLIQIVHGLSRYTPPFGHAAPVGLENYPLIGTCGTTADNSVYILLPNDMFTAHAGVDVHNDNAHVINTVIAAAAPGTQPQILPADPNHAQVDVTSAMILPPAWIDRAVQHSVDTMTRAQFATVFLQPLLGTPEENTYSQVLDWFRAITYMDATPSVVPVITLPDLDHLADRTLQLWFRNQVRNMFNAVPAPPAAQVAPADINNAFTGLQNHLSTLDATRLNRERESKTVTGKYGPVMAGILHTLTGAAGDDTLPETHQRIAAASKATEQRMVLHISLVERSNADDCIASQSSIPVVTSHLLELFRAHNLTGTGLKLGQGLSAFAIVCEGHPGADEVGNKAKNQVIVESGALGLSTTEAKEFALSDAKLPKTLNQAVERLEGLSVVVDLYFGVAHAFSTELRTFIREMGPLIRSLENTFPNRSGDAVMIANRVLFWLQQHTFQYIDTTKRGGAAFRPPWQECLAQFRMNMYHNYLPALPTTWATEIDLPKEVDPEDKRKIPGKEKPKSVVNSRADKSVTERWTKAGSSSIKTVLQGYSGEGDPPIPTFGSDKKPICLSWCLKGRCFENCGRANAHVHYGEPLIKKVHKLLDDCGVPTTA